MGRFTVALKGYEDRTSDKLDRVVYLFVLELRTRLILRSPVDTGRFRNNWQLGVEYAPTGVIEAADRSGQAASDRIRAAMPVKAAGRRYYLVNNLPYAQSLEDGGSQQAPAGVVKITVVEAPQILDRVVAAVG